MAIEINVPDIGTDEVEVTEILVSVGDKVQVEQSLVIVEGDKVSMEIPAPFDGTVKTINVNIGDKVRTGSLIMVFEVENDVSSPIPISGMNTTVSMSSMVDSKVKKFAEKNDYIHATPLIRRLAHEFNINLAMVKGTGRKGRILREDFWSYIKKIVNSAEFIPDNRVDNLLTRLPSPKIDFGKFGDTEEVELGRIQKTSGANLHCSWITIPHVTQFDEVDITEVEAFRKHQNAIIYQKKLDYKITILAFIMKAVAKALEEFPRFNSSLSEDGQKLILKKYINIGIAVDTPNGLIVPVLHNTNKKGIIRLSRELADTANKARAGKLTPSDMQGGCFTLSSLGSIGGGTAFTPIINTPEVAILGVSRSSIKPVWDGKIFIPRIMLPLSLSYDHRVIDGADGVHFISFINNLLSDIRILVM